MALVASAGEGGNYKPIEEGTYIALCYGLIDLGEVYSENFDKCSHKCMILWELDGETIKLDDGLEVNRSVSKTYTLSLNEKSSLRKDLRAWRGREFTEEELKRFELKNILNAPCQIQIVHKKTGEKTYANIAGIMALPKGMKKPEGTNTTLYWDFEEDSIDDGMWSIMPEFITNRIKESETYKYITEGKSEHLSQSMIEEIQQYESYKKMHSFAPIADGEDDPDCPF